MALWEISFRTQYDYPFIEMSGRHPGIPISMWCIWDRELLQVPTQDERELAEIEKEIKQAGRIIDKWVEAQEARIFIMFPPRSTPIHWGEEVERLQPAPTKT